MRFLLVVLSASVMVACSGDTSEESVAPAAEQAVAPESEFHEWVRFHDQVGDAWNMTIVVMRTENDEGPRDTEYVLRWLDAAGSLQLETELELGRSVFTAASGNTAAMEFISVDDPSERFLLLASGGLELYDADGLIRTASRTEN